MKFITATLSVSAALVLSLGMGTTRAQGLTQQDNVNAQQNNPVLMPHAALGSEYPTHGNRQAGELPLNPTDPRAQLINGLPNNTQAGGYGSPLAGSRFNVMPASQ
nr:hypothetical protein [Paraburkholderia flava]